MKRSYTDFIKELAITDFKLRYNNSILGYLWSLLNPLILFGTLYVVFSVLIKLDIPNYKLYLLLGIIFWQYVIESTSGGMQSVLSKVGLIQKINFPRAYIIFAHSITATITLFLNLIIFFLFYLLSDVKMGYSILLFPLFIIFLYFLSLGLAFALSAFYVRFRDIHHIWQITSQIWFWFTPIVYTSSIIPKKYFFMVYLNPLARIIEYSRHILLFNTIPSLKQILNTFLFCLLIFIFGFLIFKKMSRTFAEDA